MLQLAANEVYDVAGCVCEYADCADDSSVVCLRVICQYVCVLVVDNLTWSAVDIEPVIPARTGHAAVCCPCYYKSRDYSNVLMFGGGDNEGKFFNELFSISIPTSTAMLSLTAE